MAGTHQCHIQSDGKIDLPDILLKWINESTGTLEVTQGTYGLGIGKRRKEECSCDDITCAKCLASNCKDDECAIHTQKRKKEYLQNRSTVVKPE
ncbi:MAG: hypothetical protein Q8P93_00025 [bacterium]|nr:hypothetical protein [bacterium]